jgi:hypothetical protein
MVSIAEKHALQASAAAAIADRAADPAGARR